MPMTLEAPVLQVDANVIHKVDTTNPANLFSMWTVFARCRDSVAQGRRLENLSWRLWNRETFCCEGDEMLISACATSQPQAIQYPRDAVAEDLPQLSGSVDSVADEEAVDMTTDTTPVDIMRPRIQRQDSCASSRSRGRERHITSDELEKMVQSIMTTKEPLTAPLPIIPRSLSTEKPQPTPAPRAERTGSTTSESSRGSPAEESPKSVPSPSTPEPQSLSRTIVTRGFSPSQMPVSRITSPASNTLSMGAIPEPSDAPAPKIIFSKKQQAKFALGGSSGSEEESYRNRDIETRKLAAQPKGKMFMLGGSSGDASLDGSQQLQRPISTTNAQKKTASFNSQVVTQTYTSSAISDTEDDYDESAIDDDDEDWEEESAEESSDSVAEDKIQFTRVDSSANLPSRRSMITLMLAANNTRAQRLGNGVASQSTSAIPRTRATLNGPSLVASPNDSDEAPLMMKRGTARAPPMRPINEIPRSAAQPINVTAASMHYQAALSPRTTRRNMLATELTESLRRNLLRERSQKTQTANAVLKRRHTSHDVANLKQYPERPFMKKEKEVDTNPSSWDQYFQNPFAAHQAQAW